MSRLFRIIDPHQGSTPSDLEKQVGKERAIQAGCDELNSGARIPLEEVESWVESWDTADELPMPELAWEPDLLSARRRTGARCFSGLELV